MKPCISLTSLGKPLRLVWGGKCVLLRRRAFREACVDERFWSVAVGVALLVVVLYQARTLGYGRLVCVVQLPLMWPHPNKKLDSTTRERENVRAIMSFICIQCQSSCQSLFLGEDALCVCIG